VASLGFDVTDMKQGTETRAGEWAGQILPSRLGKLDDHVSSNCEVQGAAQPTKNDVRLSKHDRTPLLDREADRARCYRLCAAPKWASWKKFNVVFINKVGPTSPTIYSSTCPLRCPHRQVAVANKQHTCLDGLCQ